jgi:hypothetical protein
MQYGDGVTTTGVLAWARASGTPTAPEADTSHDRHGDNRLTHTPVLPLRHRLPTPSRYVRHGPPVVPVNDR